MGLILVYEWSSPWMAQMQPPGRRGTLTFMDQISFSPSRCNLCMIGCFRLPTRRRGAHRIFFFNDPFLF